MSNYLNTELDYDERLELIPALSDIARIYYDEPDKINLFAGICYQLMELGKVQGAYTKMTRLMREIGYTSEYDYFEGPEPQEFTIIEEWEPRAYMCLLLSDYLFSTLDEYAEDIQIDETEQKPLLQKVKDKFNSFVQHIKDFHEARAKIEAAARVSV